MGMSQEDAQSRNKWGWKINGATGCPRFTWKMAIKAVCVCVCLIIEIPRYSMVLPFDARTPVRCQKVR